MTEELEKWRQALHDSATQAIEMGWNVIPLSIDSKKPLIEWKEYQTKEVTHELVEHWFRDGVGGNHLFNLAVLTGAVSGIVVVDCDNQEAVKYAERHNLTSPFVVETTRGKHFYFKHPGKGQQFRNKVGGVGRDWPAIDGLDFRGDGGYAVFPCSIKVKDKSIQHVYTWNIPDAFDLGDIDDYVWHGVADQAILPSEEEFSFGSLNLENVKAFNPEDSLPVWEQIKMRVAHLGRKLMTGDGTDAVMIRYCGQKVRQGLTGENLLRSVYEFHDEFFDSSDYSLEETEEWIKSKVESAIYMDRRNWPDDYDASGERKKPEAKVESKPMAKLQPVYSGDVDRLIDSLGSIDYWADPIIPAETITQVVGYNGHGKSYFLMALLTSMSAARPEFGPYDTPKPPKVLYLDYDNPARTVLYRMRSFNRMLGDTGSNLAMWSPALISPENGGEMNLGTEQGFRLLGDWLEEIKPNIVVIDTIRNAFGGLEEASASEWFKVNHVARSIRTRYKASVVMVHHRNKPGENGLGREAGSTAQLTDIDTQVMVTQVMRTKQSAKEKAGLFDGDLSVYDMQGRESTPWAYLERQLDVDSRIKMVSQISFGKVRNQTEMHQTHYIGWAERLIDGSSYVVSTVSPLQKARYLHIEKGMTLEKIARTLSVPLHEVSKWLSP
jgi:hypothetical protein